MEKLNYSILCFQTSGWGYLLYVCCSYLSQMMTIFMISGQILFPCVKIHAVTLLLKNVEELEMMAPFEAMSFHVTVNAKTLSFIE